jgi:polar amino acid transport system permease protein
MQILLKEFPSLLQGALLVIEIAAGHLALGFLLGLVLAAMEVYGGKSISLLGRTIQKVLRGIPALVLLMLMYFGLTRVVDMSSTVIAIVALGLRSAAYQSQVFRGGIKAIESGQMEAALSIGMGKLKAIRRIILPQALRLVIGPWSNIFTMEVKDVSLAYSIGVLEILRRARFIIRYTHGNAMLLYCMIALFYFIIVRLGNTFLYRLEGKLWIPGFERRGSTKTRTR